ncbi:MAG TPA: hypothetical protein VJ183_16645 [Chloroflexia bacterium]|nr:hypothetical protein [Chloroflexia bacterium]
MSADAQAVADPTTLRLGKRARSVWAVLTLTGIVFLLSCGSITYWLAGTLGNITTPHSATLEVRTGTQVVVRRNHIVAPELVSKETTLNEGDEVETGPTSGAFVQLFDGSTIQTYFDTRLRVERLRTGALFQNLKEASIVVDSGTVVVVTADLGSYSSAKYLIATETGVIEPDVKSKVRLRVEGSEQGHLTSAFVDYGSAKLLSHGRQIQLSPGTMARVSADGTIVGPGPIEEELIRNGTFTEGPTSGAELAANGGLGIAAWLPILAQTTEPVAEPGVTNIVTETLGLGTTDIVTAARLQREGSGDTYATVGIRQEMNQPVEFLSEIELDASVKVVLQSVEAGGPQGNIFPLTIKVIYSDSEQKQHEWKHSFYYFGQDQDLTVTTKVLQGTWGRHNFVLKSAQDGVGSDMAVINAIEIYGYGRQFQSWVTQLSMIAK